jgi:hypothetical protein
MGVVHGDQRRLPRGPAAEQREDARRERPAIGRPRACLAEQGRPDRGGLRLRQLRLRIRDHRVEQVRQRRERQLRVGPRRSSGEQTDTSSARVRDRVEPKGGLADPGFALEDERVRPVDERAEEVGQGSLLDLSPDDQSRSPPRRGYRAARCSEGQLGVARRDVR